MSRSDGNTRRTAGKRTASGADGAQVSIRLNKFLADHGIASRRACDELIAAGKVLIDGNPVTVLGTRIDPSKQVVEVDGRVLRAEAQRWRYYLLNKPDGVVCTNEVRETRPRAIDMITDRQKGRIYTVGRLDEDTTGLVILTNDGEFANRVMHPRNEVPKTYKVKLRGRITDEEVQKLRGGVHLSEGKTGGARILIDRRTQAVSRLSVTLTEGKNREIRRMFARLGFKVVDLHRAQIGAIGDRGLKVGTWRPLTSSEVRELLETDWKLTGPLRPNSRGRRGGPLNRGGGKRGGKQ